ncbi:MAG: hypothetical protein L0271_01840 [Gemmatimonadetes bacterium]|nr:hypothetical protein [Gemmatimonadota bacterium]
MEAVVRDEGRTRSPLAKVRTGAFAPAAWPRRSAGALLLGLGTLPVFALLDAPSTGLAGQATAAAAATDAELMWLGALLCVIPALIAAKLAPAAALERRARRFGRVVARAPVRVCALVAALLAFALTAAFNRFALHGQPALIDAMSQLLHARWIAAGSLAGADPELGGFVNLQQGLFTEHGWVSQYPPGFPFLLALGFITGGVGLVGPALAATTAWFTMLAADRLLPGRRAEARIGAGLLALSPFAIVQAGAYMSHAAAAAFGALAIWAAARTREGRRRSSFVAGAAIGALGATRPLTALAIGLVVVAMVRRPARLLWLACGIAPFALGIALYNAHFFGAPGTWGHTAALGPAAGPGFGIDPWGNAYGPLQAAAYTSAELTALSVFLFETPFPVVALIGLALLISRRVSPGERVIAAWALLPLAANLFYWHHGLFMGPRMLADAAPAWSLLAVLSAGSLLRAAPAVSHGWSPRVFLATAVGAALVAGLFWLGPARLASYRIPPSAAYEAARTVDGPALVFVHGGWTSRVAMRLAAAGMRLDSVETALRRNPTCGVEEWLGARERGDAQLAPLDLEPRAESLPAVEISPGNRMRARPGDVLTAACAREVAADARGVIEVAALYWRGDLPGRNGAGTLFVRDLGPERNARLIRRFADRRAWFLLHQEPSAAPVLVPYAQGEALLWPEARGDAS